jgi:hypothetical protein
LVLLVPVLGLACGDEKPVDVNGTYILNVTSSTNECMAMGWMEGAQSMGNVTLSLTQLASDSSQVSGEVHGAGAGAGWVELFFALAYQSNRFSGTVTGKDVEMKLVGSGRTQTMGACTFTPTARASAKVEGDTITGSLYHHFDTNKVPECGYRNTCANTQNFNGARPPR